MSMSNFLENKVLDYILKGTTFAVSPVYASLHTADPGETGTNEVTGGSYARVQITTGQWDAAASGATQTNAAKQFDALPAATVTHFGLWDASSAGNFLYSGALAASKTVASGDSLLFASGDIDVTQD